MRVCFTSDLHGDRVLYAQLAELLRAARPDLLVLGGDLWRDVELQQPVLPQVAEQERFFLQQIDAWRAELPALQLACIVGNHEITPMRLALQRQHEAGRLVLLDHRQAWRHGGQLWLGYGNAPPSPHWAKDHERLDLPGDPPPAFEGVVWDAATERLVEADLREHFTARTSMALELDTAPRITEPWMLVAHAPPHDTKLDRLPHVPYPIGSRAVRAFIAAHQPRVALHGHVHESPGLTGSFTDQIGNTLCISPGQGIGRLHAVTFDLANPAQTVRHTVFG
jgi:Icc-related predicted phosphoesterase